jgi:hypothetical protein
MILKQIMSLAVDNAKFVHEQKGKDPEYAQQVSQGLNQQMGALVQEAMFLALKFRR